MYSRYDYLRRMADDFAGHRITRREFVRRATLLGLSTPLITALIAACGGDDDDDDDSGAAATNTPAAESSTGTPAEGAESDEDPVLVVASWGGNFGEVQREAQFEPFMEETGIELTLAPEQPDIALLEAQVTSGNVTWDLANNSNLGAYTLAGKDLLESIDYSKMNPEIVAGLDERIKGEYSVGIYFWSSLLGYNLTFFEEGNYPASWADFWDVDAFPGPRGLTEMNFEPPPLEIPLLAQGVAPADLYPLDIDAAFSSLDEIRDDITVWTGFGADGTQLLVQSELAMSSAGNGSLTNAIADGAELGMEWNQGLVYFDAWSIPRGAQHPNNALLFIEFCSRPEVQAAFVNGYPIGAVVPAAYEFVPEEVAANSTSAPQNLEVQVVTDTEWWTTIVEGDMTNLEVVYQRWAEWLL